MSNLRSYLNSMTYYHNMKGIVGYSAVRLVKLWKTLNEEERKVARFEWESLNSKVDIGLGNLPPGDYERERT